MKEIFDNTTGIPLDHFFRLGIACGGHFLHAPCLNIEQVYSDPELSSDISAAFFDRLTYPIKCLKEATIAEQRYDDGWPYSFNPLRARPFIQFDTRHPEQILCPIPTFLINRISDGLSMTWCETQSIIIPLEMHLKHISAMC